MLRLCGDQDVKPGFAPAAFLGDFVVSGRFGGWFPPSGADGLDPRLAASLHVGYRVTLISDAIDVVGRELEP